MGDDARAIVDAVLQRALAALGYRQMFLFGPTGDPFWAARLPVTAREIVLLDLGMRLLEKLEDTRAKPFTSFDPVHAIVTTALDGEEDLYVVVLQDSWSGAPAEVAARLRAELSRDLPALRRAVADRGRSEPS